MMNLEKRKVLLFLLVIGMIIVGIIIWAILKDKVGNGEESIEEKNTKVDVAIQELIQSSEYKNMSEEEKKEACQKLLQELEKQKAIKQYYYMDGIYSFKYMDDSLRTESK